MRTIDWYLDQAKLNGGFRSDRQLGEALGYKSNTVSFMRQKKSWPGDDTMLTLADLAEVDHKTALLDLNIWRASGAARKVYEAIARTAAAALIACFLAFSSPATAGTVAEHSVNYAASSIYYGKLFIII